MKKCLSILFIVILILSTATFGFSFDPQNSIDKTLLSQLNTKSEVQLSIVGDVMFHSPQIYSAYNPTTKTYNFDPSFQHIKKYIEASDYAIANYETTSYDQRQYSGYPRFNAPKETIEALKNSGFDLLLTANNHILDTTIDGTIATLDTMHHYGFDTIGTEIKDHYDASLIKELNGIKFGFLNYTYGLNGLSVYLNHTDQVDVNVINSEQMIKDVQTMKSKVDFVIVFIHWGQEYQVEPNTFQTSLADELFKNGVDVIIGSHPHVIQKSEFKNDQQFIIYSMGNFLSNQRESNMSHKNRYLTEDGLILNLTFEKDYYKDIKKIKDVDYIYTWVHRTIAAGHFNYEILPVNEFLLKNEHSPQVINRLKASKKHTSTKMQMKPIQFKGDD
jgi:poly-gamma-glutamate synthesis protein (capsule biosynthesis protein)